MKCPKCGYLGFEEVDRCRNCGFDFSLAPSPPPPDLTIRSDSSADGQLADLPLFGDDTPMITKASPPRQPLAVRRATPEIPRLKPEPFRTPMLELDALDAERPVTLLESDLATVPTVARRKSQPIEDARPAGYFARSIAFAIDVVVLSLIDVAVIYLTLKICSLSVEELWVLPKAPLITFLLVQNGAYLVAFTVGGQTLGKMAAGIRVIPADPAVPLDLGHSIIRAFVWMALAIPAGLGFLSAVFSNDRRGLHDRCAGTRVVRTA